MSSAPTIKAVTNGTSTDDTSKADDCASQRISGLALVWEQQVYYTASLGESALLEAEQLLRKIQKLASNAYRHEATKPLDMTEVGDNLHEAIDCIEVVMEHLSALSVSIRSRVGEQIPCGPLF